MLLKISDRNGLKRAVITFLVVILAVCLVANNNMATTAAYWTDIETASANSFQGWNASL